MGWTVLTAPAFQARVRRHFVALGGTLQDLDDNGGATGDERHFCCSGFVVSIRGTWCLVTAGHVLLQIDNGVRSGRHRLLKFGLMDYFSTAAVVKEPTPFPYPSVHRIALDDDDVGYDFGIIPLGDLFRASVAANGVLPIPVAAWDSRSPPRFDTYALLGMPVEEMVAVSREGPRGPQIGHQVNLILAGVEPLSVAPPARVASHVPRFAAWLRDGDELESVVGMSGGPIIGINPASREYACIAIQGSWRSQTRMVLGTPMGILVDAINRLLD